MKKKKMHKLTTKQKDKRRKKRVLALRREQKWLNLPDKVKDQLSQLTHRLKKQHKTTKKYKRENNKYNWK